MLYALDQALQVLVLELFQTNCRPVGEWLNISKDDRW